MWYYLIIKKNSMAIINFEIIKSNLTTLNGALFLVSDAHHCHSKESVKKLLDSDDFRESNADLVPIYEKALEIMDKGVTGFVGCVKI